MSEGPIDEEDAAGECAAALPAAHAGWARAADIPLAELVAATRVKIRTLFRLAGVSHADAEDIFQESLLSVYTHWHEIRNPEAYLRRTVRMQVRLLRRRRERAAELSLDTASAVAGLPAVPAVQEASDRRCDLETLLERLPERARQVLALQYAEQLTAREIAILLGCAAPAVRKTASRAMERLRRDARVLKLG
jgi:RNA polymerase sigma factor (sigma-70 family)